MKTLKNIALLAGLSLLFMGCPYESAVPVDAQSASKSDAALVGTWRDTADDTYQYKVTLSGTTYSIEKRNIKDHDATPTNYTGWLSTLNGATFFNISEVNTYSDDKKYYIYKIEKTGDLVKFRAVTDNITEQFTTSAQLQTFMKANMNLSFFYNKDDEKVYGMTQDHSHSRANEK